MGQIIKRKLFRLLALFFPLIYLYYSQKQTIFVSAVVAAVALIIESLRFYNPKIKRVIEGVFSPIGKEEETQRISGITYLVLGCFLTVIFFEKLIAIPVLFCAIFGDVISPFIKGKIKIFRNKSLEGMVACFLICFLIGVILINLEILEGLTLELILVISLLISLFETISLPLDDNLSTPLGVGLISSIIKNLWK
ncbi:hypothetical protein COS93_00730 [bacterium (Candidatus Gribaldobacteria) CG07_land_8_20_14_0_80_33_18]|uniref:Phosphatidate cytidylyltransferase n=1 Tax=bacterium (Candidatus Gribaldobacteria) CG07_land_8_20_14_0_80_33_18 TaxID=2014272 RepID=A0A2M6Z3V3_9BACT|nr:MAG: hypothetical protein COU04_01855 [bacterium (Candidatus Gribaldobacteria) CG10_big_fil_rev_8_21_14_0_10_33_41]PIU47088.1 MAG: hypothetical protein COS93_00730 [bacterium (Candidatus Gribaldobacteria) CG07_land_8_20_14_0_80_33_18]PJA00372.1 MAG: hypothetical protein COX75_02505 [bacterium (Candidatus Gribaldobacteria) CG_4_10_14_0_2_um_filter_33_15]PJB08968.1 MAG: hypothetical protein CO122_00560 [bacterium (Candidatus Gribaldobacteria) CG_4_9_14_3_um_filter_33_9]